MHDRDKLITRLSKVSYFCEIHNIFLCSKQMDLETGLIDISSIQRNNMAQQQLWQNWPIVNAVEKQHMITINADRLHRYTRRSIQGLKSLCTKIDTIRSTK